MHLYYAYDEDAITHLKKRDRALGRVIDQIGHIDREVEPDLFSSVIYHIVGQQISSAALNTVWGRMQEGPVVINANTIAAQPVETLQQFGMTFKKAGYIKTFAQQVLDGTLDIAALPEKSDAEIITALSSLNGIGVWTAEMILTFCLQRSDVLSYGDLAIHRGMRMLYRRRQIDRDLFETYRKRYSPYGTVASFYLWAIASGAIEGLYDHAPKRKAVSKTGKSPGK